MLIFRRIQLYTCSIWYRHSLWQFVVVCRYTAWVRTDCGWGRFPTNNLPPPQSVLTQAVYRQFTTNSHREWQYHKMHVYNCILLKKSTWGSKHVEEINILWINNNQCIKLVINNCILLKMGTWGSKHVEEYNIFWINNNQCIKLVINTCIHGVRKRLYPFFIFFLGAQCVESGVSCTDCY